MTNSEQVFTFDESKVFSDLLDIVSESEEFAQINDRLAIYSPFEALGVADYEVRHGNFLADIFNPNGTHGFGSAPLELLLKQIFQGHAHHGALEQVVLGSLSRTRILREWHNIDLVLELNDLEPKIVVAIELKLHSNEHSNQLKKYQKIVNEATAYENYREFFVFLTPEGVESSLPEVWQSIAMTEGFIQGLKKIAQGQKGDPFARAMLSDYVNVMEKKFMPNEELESLAEKLWNRYPDALNFLADHRPNRMSKIFEELKAFDDKKLTADLAGMGFDFPRKWDYETTTMLLLTFPEWDSFSGVRCQSFWDFWRDYLTEYSAPSWI